MLALGFMASCQDTSAQITLYRSTASAYATNTALASDTLTGTDTTYFSNRRGTLTKSEYANYCVWFRIDTTAYTNAPTYNCYLQGSDDGITWFNLNGAPMGTDGINADTLNATTFTGLQRKMSAYSGATKFVNGGTRGSNAVRCEYVRLMVTSSGAGTSGRVYNVYLRTSKK